MECAREGVLGLLFRSCLGGFEEDVDEGTANGRDLAIRIIASGKDRDADVVVWDEAEEGAVQADIAGFGVRIDDAGRVDECVDGNGVPEYFPGCLGGVC